jgi:hypothetical protein
MFTDNPHTSNFISNRDERQRLENAEQGRELDYKNETNSFHEMSLFKK